MPVKPGNPLYVQWIQEWHDDAVPRGPKSASTYKNALKSMKACPVTFHHPSEAGVLHGVGPKICARLAERLEAHCEQNGLVMPQPRRTGLQKRQNEDDTAPEGPSKRVRKVAQPKGYVPKRRSGAYAIVMALSTIPEESRNGMTKAEVISIAHEWSDHSFTAPSDPKSWYTAWGSMKTLESKEIVYISGKPTKKYALTEDGWELAKRIRGVEGDTNAGDATDDEGLSSAPSTARVPSNLSRSCSTQIAPPFKPSVTAPTRSATVMQVVDLLSDDDEAHFPVYMNTTYSASQHKLQATVTAPATPRRSTGGLISKAPSSSWDGEHGERTAQS